MRNNKYKKRHLNLGNKISLMLAALMLLSCFQTTNLYAKTEKVSGNTTTSDTSDSSTDDTSSDSTSTSHDTYDSATSTSSYVMPANTWVTPETTYGQDVIVVLPLVNMFKYNLKDVIITPVVSTKASDWPFEIQATGYTQKLDSLLGEEACPTEKDRVQNVAWSFKTRDDVLTGYYKIDYNILYTNPACQVESCTISTFVKTTGKTGAGTTENGASGSDNTSTPRVIVSGFTTTPADVYAGDTFTLNLGIENTSKRTAVSNLEFTLEAAVEGKDDNTYSAFLPTSGSNTIYIDKIAAGGKADISIDLTAKADLIQKPYVMKINMAYEDDDYNAFTEDSSVSIPVKQISKFETSSPEITPESIMVGEESNIMFSIYNTGKTKLYNVSVKFLGDSIEGGDCFIGPLESGATGNVDAMVTGAAPTQDDGVIKAEITYEDESGNVTKEEKDITLVVDEAVSDNMLDDMGDMEEETTTKSPVPLIIVIVVILLAIIAGGVVFFSRKKHKKAIENELEELNDALEEEQEHR